MLSLYGLIAIINAIIFELVLQGEFYEFRNDFQPFRWRLGVSQIQQV